MALLIQVIGVLGVAWGEPAWWVPPAALQLAFLLAPSSRAYVWREANLRRRHAVAEKGASGWAVRLSSGAFWEEVWSWIDDRAVNGRFIGFLGVFVLVAFPMSWGLSPFSHIAFAASVLAFLLLLGLS